MPLHPPFKTWPYPVGISRYVEVDNERRAVLYLDGFRCCSGATVKYITFTVDSRNRAVMSEVQGRTIRYCGQLRMFVDAGSILANAG